MINLMFTFKGHWFLLQRAWVPNTSSFFNAQFKCITVINVTPSSRVEKIYVKTSFNIPLRDSLINGFILLVFYSYKIHHNLFN
jgi:hypothetical protein